MSAQLEPRVRYQAQVCAPESGEWWDRGGREKSAEDAKSTLSGKWKSRIVKQTTTFEVVEEMEPKQ